MQNRSFLLVPALIAAGLAAAACGSAADVSVGASETSSVELPAAVGGADVTYDDHGDPVGLHRFRKWSDRVYQSAQPEGDEAFRNLAAMGVTTVLSVDGARPDLESAEKYGIRYVHVPIGYHGLTRDQQLQIVKAVQISDGITLVHCHHGKHRGPAAAMTARLALEGIDKKTAYEGLVVSECSPKYKGLYADVENFVSPTEAELAAVSEDLPAYVAPPAIVDAMIDVDFRKDNLRMSRDEAWSAPKDSPDVSAPHEARMLWESYREMGRLDESKKLGERFMALLVESEEAAIDLEKALRANDAEKSEDAWQRVMAGCNDCHIDYRNNK